MNTTAPFNGKAFTQMFNMTKMRLLCDNKGTLIDKGQKVLLKSLRDNRNRQTLTGNINIIYRLTSTKPGEMGFGRYYGQKGSLETIEKDIRGTLAQEFYSDIDIVNCHPTLMVQIAKRLDIQMPGFEEYNTNRDTIIKTLAAQHNCFESTIKDIPIRIAYGGAIKFDNETKVNELQNLSSFPLWAVMKEDIERLYNKLKESDMDSKVAELLDYCKRQKNNVKGTFLSLILQTYERNCLEAIVSYFKENGMEVDVLCYDGCMVRSRDITDEMLLAAEEAVKEQTGFDIKLKIKPLIGISDEELNINDEVEEEVEYKNIKAEWETNHFYFKPNNTIVEFVKQKYNAYTIDHAMVAFNYLQLSNKKDDKKVLFIKKWLEDPTRRVVDEYVYKYAEDCLPNEATLFTGFAYQNMEECEESAEAVEKFNEILLNIANNSKEHFDFLTKLFAFRVQKPFEKANICTIFSGSQGVGKDTILEWMQSVIGRQYCAMYLSDTEFWEKHDTKKEGALMMYLQEAGVGANRANSNALKSRITSPYIDINPKGMKTYKVPNMALYFMTTNESSPIKMEEDDRRYYLLRAGEKNMGNIEFWNHIYGNMNKPEWVYSIGKHLERVDLTGFNANAFPETEERKVLKEMGRCPEKMFLEQFDWEGREFTCSELYKPYKSYCMDNDMQYKISSNSFGRELTKYLNKLLYRRNAAGVSKYYKK